MTSTIDLHDIRVLDANSCVLDAETQSLTINAFDGKGGCQSVSFFLPADEQSTEVVQAVVAAIKAALLAVPEAVA
jgi:hypothetical protein